MGSLVHLLVCYVSYSVVRCCSEVYTVSCSGMVYTTVVSTSTSTLMLLAVVQDTDLMTYRMVDTTYRV